MSRTALQLRGPKRQPAVWLICLFLLHTVSGYAEENRPAWTLGTPAANDPAGPRILLYHDMEGLSGQNSIDTFFVSKPEYAQGQELLAADINAVVAGLFEGGASAVHIVDGHGSGNPEPDLRTDLLDPRAQQVFRTEPFDAYADLAEAGAYDAIAVVGMHAKTGSFGFASHTINPGIGVYINGQSITETELIGLSWGRVDTPVIFASGDDRLANDLKDSMPWLHYVTVKTARGAADAVLRPVDEARAELRSSARQAVMGRGEARVMKVTTPIVASVLAVPPASLTVLQDVPGIDYHEGRATFTAADFQSAYAGVEAFIAVARGAYADYAMGAMAQDGGPSIRSRFQDGLIRVWYEQESGTFQPPQATAQPKNPPGEQTPKRFHGYR